MSEVSIRPMRPADWASVEAIYRDGIATGNATFEPEPPDWSTFDGGKLSTGRLVAVDVSDRIVGWVAASAVSERKVYRGVVEHSVYVSPSARGRRIGFELMRAFLREADAAGVWTVQSSIFPENAASLRLHDRLGFRRVGTRERIALMTYGPWAGRWRDTVLIERRRSD